MSTSCSYHDLATIAQDWRSSACPGNCPGHWAAQQLHAGKIGPSWSPCWYGLQTKGPPASEGTPGCLSGSMGAPAPDMGGGMSWGGTMGIFLGPLACIAELMGSVAGTAGGAAGTMGVCMGGLEAGRLVLGFAGALLPGSGCFSVMA